jgi:glycosyltransferase involved in cell wall biosynthesis
MHPFARRFELDCRRAEQIIYAANALKVGGFHPQLIYAHPGWGEALPLRVLYPQATICSYAEFYYAPRGTDVGFDREFPQYGLDGETRVVLRNAATLLALADADFAVSPTRWQQSVFPPEFQPKIRVVHDGLDTQRLAPPATAPRVTVGARYFGPEDEIITFVSRNLEPYRGFHIFMRALPAILRARRNVHICILGGDQVSYGAAPATHESWRAAMLEELGGRFDPGRVHFLGKVPHDTYLSLLALSRAHVYLTYPFVLSWSMLEAMAMECLVVGSDTPPVAEVIRHGENGLLVPFFDVDALAATIVDALSRQDELRPLRKAARETIRRDYDFKSVSWPKHLELLRAIPALRQVAGRLGEAEAA